MSDLVDNKRKRYNLLQKADELMRKSEEHVGSELSLDMTDDTYLDMKFDESSSPKSSNSNDTPIIKKGRGRPKKHMESIEWSDEATEALIELWQTKDELFCRNHPYFYAKDYKDRAIESIRVQMEERGFHTTTNQILGKIQSLRTYFCSQRAKFQQLRKAGHVTDEESECRWRFYKSLQFLDENMKPRDSLKKEKGDNDSSYLNGSYPPPSMHYPTSMAYEGHSHHLNTYDGGHVKVNNKVDNGGGPTKAKLYEDHLFGELVGNMMSQLPPGQHKDLLKLEIQQLIIKAKYDTTNSMGNCSD